MIWTCPSSDEKCLKLLYQLWPAQLEEVTVATQERHPSQTLLLAIPTARGNVHYYNCTISPHLFKWILSFKLQREDNVLRAAETVARQFIWGRKANSVSTCTWGEPFHGPQHRSRPKAKVKGKTAKSREFTKEELLLHLRIGQGCFNRGQKGINRKRKDAYKPVRLFREWADEEEAASAHVPLRSPVWEFTVTHYGFVCFAAYAFCLNIKEKKNTSGSEVLQNLILKRYTGFSMPVRFRYCPVHVPLKESKLTVLRL